MNPLKSVGAAFDKFWYGLLAVLMLIGALMVAFWVLLWMIFPTPENLEKALSEALMLFLVPIEVVVLGLGTLGTIVFVIAHIRGNTSF